MWKIANSMQASQIIFYILLRIFQKIIIVTILIGVLVESFVDFCGLLEKCIFQCILGNLSSTKVKE